jgi:hypothetical protein
MVKETIMESFPVLLRRALLPAAALLVLFSLVVIPSASVSAGTFNPGCSVANLVSNLATAGSNSQDDTINLASGCTYTLSSTLVVNGDSGYQLTINGNNAILDGDDVTGVLLLNSLTNVFINNVTIRDGSRTKGGGIYNTGGTATLTNVTVSGGTANDSGGGIYNAGGTMTLTNSTVSDSSAVQSGGGVYNSGTMTLNISIVSGNSAGSSGGGISNTGTMTLNSGIVNGGNNAHSGGGISSTGSLTLNSSTVSGNWGTNGGGIYSDGTTTLTNSTIGGNLASYGGGLYTLSGGPATLRNSTVNLNYASTLGGNIRNNGGSVTLNNSLVANSTSGGDCADVSGNFVFASYSLMEDGSCGVVNGVSGNRTGDPNLGALTGSPGYYPLLNGSNAINAGSNALVPGGVTTDQAGNTRIQGGIVDMGSFESNITPTVTPTAPAPDVNLISNGTFSAGLTNWSFSGTTQQISNGALQIAPTSPGGGFFQFVNFTSGSGVLEATFRAANSSATAKTLNFIVRSTNWSLQYNCVFSLPANAPFQNYRMRFNTSPNSFVPMVVQGTLSGDSSMGVLIDDITLMRKTGLTVPSTQCTVSPPPNVDLVYDGAFNQGTANWAAFNAAMQVVNIGGANGNVMELARWQGTPNGGFYQFNPYSAPANGVLQFTFQIGNQSNTARVINMLVRNPDWTDLHSCFITVPANTPLTSQTILLKTSVAWTNIVIQGWIQVGNYNGTPPLPFRFDNLNLQYLPSSGFSGSTQCPGPIPMPQHPTLMPSQTATMTSSATATPSMTATASPTATVTATSAETALPIVTATVSETPTATVEPPTFTPEPPMLTSVPTDTATDVPTSEPPTDTPSPPTPLPEGEGSPTAEVTQSP